MRRCRYYIVWIYVPTVIRFISHKKEPQSTKNKTKKHIYIKSKKLNILKQFLTAARPMSHNQNSWTKTLIVPTVDVVILY